MSSTWGITKLTFSDGTTLTPGRVTIIVGPNNSGKSRALQDIASSLEQDANSSRLVVTDASLSTPSTWTDVASTLPNIHVDDRPSKVTLAALLPDLEREFNVTTNYNGDLAEALNSQLSGRTLRSFLGCASVAHLRTDTRLTLLKDIDTPPTLQTKATGVLACLYRGRSDMESRVSAIIERHFRKQLALDFSSLRHLRLRLADTFADVPPDLRDQLEPMSRKPLLNDEGDGVRSFAAVVVALEAAQRPIWLIDEPEAFLHPPQAFQLGRLLGKYGDDDTRTFVIATHSVDVVRGVLATYPTADIVRLTREGNSNSACVLDPAALREVLDDPLLSSARVLDGLFYSSACVVEGESDARFLSAALHRVAPAIDTHFVSTGGKQTVGRVMSLYRDLHVVNAGVVDIDVFRDTKQFTTLCTQLDVPPNELEEARAAIVRGANADPPEERFTEFQNVLETISSTTADVNATHTDPSSPPLVDSLSKLQKLCSRGANVLKPWRKLKSAGRDALPEDSRPHFDTASDRLRSVGLFVMPFGELEASLKGFGVPYNGDNKAAWLSPALNCVAHLEVDRGTPFWLFIQSLHDALASPNCPS